MKTIEQYEEIISNLHRQLAAERLRADTAWQRYENANMGQKLAREELAKLNAKIAEKDAVEPDYEAIARKAGYKLGRCTNKFYYWEGQGTIDSNPYDESKQCWKAACENNGLLGEEL